MSSTATSDAPSTSLPMKADAPTKSKKNKKKGKKLRPDSAQENGNSKSTNGLTPGNHKENDGEGDDNASQESTEPPTPTLNANNVNQPHQVNGIDVANPQTANEDAQPLEKSDPQNLRRLSRSQKPTVPESPAHPAAENAFSADRSEEFNALMRERDALRKDASETRKAIEELQRKHEAEIVAKRQELVQIESERDEKGEQYQNLLGKVNTIRSQLGERLKADAEDLAQARAKIGELEEQNTNLQEENQNKDVELSSLVTRGDEQSKELSSLRNRGLLSQQNFSKEREELLEREKMAKEEFEAAKQAMQEWEILALEERSTRVNVQEKVADLEEQVASNREAHKQAASERDTQTSNVEALQRALQELQEARRRELREIVESSQTQIENLQKQVHEKEKSASEMAGELQTLKQELQRALPFEKEVKEKNLLIGKLRHEAVILSDHLTKTLRYVRKGKPEDTIDKQIITNHIMRFLELDRADSKKFQVLQIIAGMLSWTDEQREQAGLTRPGASNPNLRVPISPWHRTPSTPSLNADIAFDSSSRKESLAELWSDFLEQEAGERTKSPKSPDSSVAVSSSESSKPP